MGALANYKSYSYLKYSIYTNKVIPIGLYAVGAAAFILVMIFSTVYTWRKVKRGNICEELRQEAVQEKWWPGSFKKGASTNDFVGGPNSAGSCQVLYCHSYFERPATTSRLVKHIVSAPVTFSKKNVERYGLSFSKLLKIKLAIKFSLMYNNKIENIYF